MVNSLPVTVDVQLRVGVQDVERFTNAVQAVKEHIDCAHSFATPSLLQSIQIMAALESMLNALTCLKPAKGGE